MNPTLSEPPTAQHRESPATQAPSAPGGGLSPEQRQALADARRRGRKINRAAGVAAFSGYTLAVFAFLTLLTGLFDASSLLLGAGLGVVAHFELDGGRRMRRIDPAAPQRLGINQLSLGAMLVLYGAWHIFQTLSGPGRYDEYLSAGGPVADMLGPIDQLHTLASVLLYGGVIAVGIFAQGAAALYYFTRKAHVTRFRAETPRWVVEMLAETG